MPDPIGDHFRQPADTAATALSAGVLTAWVVFMAGFDGDARQLGWLFGAFTALPAGGYLLARVIRPFKGPAARPPGRCSACGASGPVTAVRFLKHTGLVIVMVDRELAGFTCRPCARAAFLRATLHTLVLGWWGLFSLFVTPGYLLNNVLFLVRAHVTGGSGTGHRQALEEHREWIAGLAATKDPATVVEVVAKETGVPVEEVVAFLRELAR